MEINYLGGHKEALGDWERTGGSSSKKNKQKKNKSTAKNDAISTNTSKSRPQTNDISNGYIYTIASQSVANNGTSSLLNGNISHTSTTLNSHHLTANQNSVSLLRPSVPKSKPAETTSNFTVVQAPVVSAEEVARFRSLNDGAKLKGFFLS